jgi:hypothetical protein
VNPQAINGSLTAAGGSFQDAHSLKHEIIDTWRDKNTRQEIR